MSKSNSSNSTSLDRRILVMLTGIMFILFLMVKNIVYGFEYAITIFQDQQQILSYGFESLFSLKHVFDFSFLSIGIGGLVAILFGTWFLYRQTHKKNYRPNEEHGSAKLGDINSLKKFDARQNEKKSDDSANLLLSKNIHMDMDTRHTHLNDNVMVIGGSGTGKTYTYVKPNLLQMYCNYVAIDPKGSVAEETGNAFKENHYEIRYLNLVNMKKSMGYNPFAYFHEPNDVQKFVMNLVNNTTNQNKKGGDDFFEKAEITLIAANCFYVRHCFAGTAQCNFNTVMDLFELADAKEEDNDDYSSALDYLYSELEFEVKTMKAEGADYEDYIFGELAVKNYKLFKKGAGKTAKSVLISVGVRLSIFNLPALKKMLEKDELCLDHLGKPMVKNQKYPDDLSKDISWDTYESIKKQDYEELKVDDLRKVVLFIITSDSDDTFTFMTAIILQQIYDRLYYAADQRRDHRLPIHTRIVNDEFATCGKQMAFDRKVATVRSRGISVDIIIQGISQIKSLYKDSWETIFENCDYTVFLGGKGLSTNKMLSELIGNETVVHKNYSESKGTQSSVTVSDQIIQRPLRGPDEISRLHPIKCLIHIRGYQIFEDFKYSVADHPNVDLTTDSLDPVLARKNFFDIFKYHSKILDYDSLRNSRNLNNEISHPEEVLQGGIIEGNLDLVSKNLQYLQIEQLEDYLKAELDTTEEDEILAFLPKGE